jgi:hypothetical protein
MKRKTDSEAAEAINQLQKREMEHKSHYPKGLSLNMITKDILAFAPKYMYTY